MQWAHKTHTHLLELFNIDVELVSQFCFGLGKGQNLGI
jgi:hypothetical protein